MRALTISQAKQNFSQVIASAERGETIVITRKGKPVAKITRQAADRISDPECKAAFAALRESLRAKPPTGYRVGKMGEDDKYGDDRA